MWQVAEAPIFGRLQKAGENSQPPGIVKVIKRVLNKIAIGLKRWTLFCKD